MVHNRRNLAGKNEDPDRSGRVPATVCQISSVTVFSGNGVYSSFYRPETSVQKD